MSRSQSAQIYRVRNALAILAQVIMVWFAELGSICNILGQSLRTDCMLMSDYVPHRNVQMKRAALLELDSDNVLIYFRTPAVV